MQTPVKNNGARAGASAPDTPESHVQAARKAAAPEKKEKKKQEPHVAEEDGHFFSFPLYELSAQRELFFVGGGGGSVASGVPNMWAVFQWMPTSDSLKKVALSSNGPAIVTNGVISPSLTHVAVGRGRNVALIELEDEKRAIEVETEPADKEGDEAEQKACCFSRNGKKLLCGGTSGRITVLDVSSLAVLFVDKTAEGPVTRLCSSPHDDLVAALTPTCVRVFSLAADGSLAVVARHEVAGLTGLRGAQLRGLAFAGTSSAPVIAVGAVSRPEKRSQIVLVGGARYEEVARPVNTGNEPQTCLCSSQDGSLLATGTAEGSVAVYSVKGSMRLVMMTRPHSFFVSGVCFSPDGTHVLSVSGDRSLLVQLVVQRTNRGTLGVALLLALLLLLLIAYWASK